MAENEYEPPEHWLDEPGTEVTIPDPPTTFDPDEIMYEPPEHWLDKPGTEVTIPDPPTTFDPDEIMLLRKAVWMTGVKYDELRIKAQRNRGIRPANAGASSAYWAKKHDEMTNIYVKLGTVLRLSAPPF